MISHFVFYDYFILWSPPFSFLTTISFLAPYLYSRLLFVGPSMLKIAVLVHLKLVSYFKEFYGSNQILIFAKTRQHNQLKINSA